MQSRKLKPPQQRPKIMIASDWPRLLNDGSNATFRIYRLMRPDSCLAKRIQIPSCGKRADQDCCIALLDVVTSDAAWRKFVIAIVWTLLSLAWHFYWSNIPAAAFMQSRCLRDRSLPSVFLGFPKSAGSELRGARVSKSAVPFRTALLRQCSACAGILDPSSPNGGRQRSTANYWRMGPGYESDRKRRSALDDDQ